MTHDSPLLNYTALIGYCILGKLPFGNIKCTNTLHISGFGHLCFHLNLPKTEGDPLIEKEDQHDSCLTCGNMPQPLTATAHSS